MCRSLAIDEPTLAGRPPDASSGHRSSDRLGSSCIKGLYVILGEVIAEISNSHKSVTALDVILCKKNVRSGTGQRLVRGCGGKQMRWLSREE